MAKQECNPAELDKETLDALGRCWAAVSVSTRAVNGTQIGQEIAKRKLEAA